MKKLLKITFLILIVGASLQGYSQSLPYSNVNLGIGMGIDYGGFGGRLTYFPHQNVGIFGAAGYNLEGLGYNFGATFRLMPLNRTRIFAVAMYGYNAVSIVSGDSDSEYNKTFNGPSFGIGLELASRRNYGRYFNFELLYPLRSDDYSNTIDAMNRDPNIGEVTEAFPIAFSIGYHFAL